MASALVKKISIKPAIHLISKKLQETMLPMIFVFSQMFCEMTATKRVHPNSQLSSAHRSGLACLSKLVGIHQHSTNL